MRNEKGERAGALMSRMVISPFSFFFPPPRSLHSDSVAVPLLKLIHEKNLSPPFPPRPLRSSAGEV